MKVVFCFLAALLAVATAWPYYKSMSAKEAVGQHYGNICEWNPTHPLCHGTGDFKTPPLNCRRFPHHPLCRGFKSAGFEVEPNFCDRYPDLCQSFKSSSIYCYPGARRCDELCGPPHPFCDRSFKSSDYAGKIENPTHDSQFKSSSFRCDIYGRCFPR